RRINNDWVQGQRIDVKKMLKDGNLAEDLHLQNGDMLYVPKNFISKVQPWLTSVSQFVKLNLFTKPITFSNYRGEINMEQINGNGHNGNGNGNGAKPPASMVKEFVAILFRRRKLMRKVFLWSAL